MALFRPCAISSIRSPVTLSPFLWRVLQGSPGPPLIDNTFFFVTQLWGLQLVNLRADVRQGPTSASAGAHLGQLLFLELAARVVD